DRAVGDELEGLGLCAEGLGLEDVDAPAARGLLAVGAEVVQRDVGGALRGLVKRETHGLSIAAARAADVASVGGAVAVAAAAGGEQERRGGCAGDGRGVLPVPHWCSVLRLSAHVVRRVQRCPGGSGRGPATELGGSAVCLGGSPADGV